MNHFHVYFMPWLTIYSVVKLGKITFWNYSREADERIKSDEIRSRLDTHFNSYKTRSNASVDNATICSFEGKSFTDRLEENKYIHLQEAITALAFASIIPKIEKRIQGNSKHSNPPSINSFDLMYRILNINSNEYSHITPSVMSLGLRDNEHYIQEPLILRGDAHPNSKWIDYLSAYLSLKKSNKWQNHISRSLEFFKLSHAQHDIADYSGFPAFLTRIVLNATAFESLLDFPSFAKKSYFSSYINDRFSLKKSRKCTRKELRKKYPKVRFSAVACWAYDFYNLRNSIVHGDKIEDERLRFKKGLWFNQMDVADLVFADCLEEIILSEKILKPTGDETDEIIANIFQKRGVINWEKHHKILGWLK